jgi:hypothetical protein
MLQLESMKRENYQQPSSLLFRFFIKIFLEWVIELFNIADEEYDLIPACGNVNAFR